MATARVAPAPATTRSIFSSSFNLANPLPLLWCAARHRSRRPHRQRCAEEGCACMRERLDAGPRRPHPCTAPVAGGPSEYCFPAICLHGADPPWPKALAKLTVLGWAS